MGTSSGTPTRSRNVSGIAIRKAHSKNWCLIDCGEATQHQILHTRLSLNNLQAVFITHVHGDHCYGIPGLLASATMSGRTDPLWLIGPSQIKELVDAIRKTTQLKLGYELIHISIEKMHPPFSNVEFCVEAVELSHRVPSFAYCFSEMNLERKLDIEKLERDHIEAGPIWGQIQKGLDVVLPNGQTILADNYRLESQRPRKIIISGDNDSPNLLANSAKTANVLVHEATYTHEVATKIGPEPQHSSARMVAQFAHDIGIENLVLTHFSPRYQPNNNDTPSIADIEQEAKSAYRKTLFLANDLDRFLLNKHGELVKVDDALSDV